MRCWRPKRLYLWFVLISAISTVGNARTQIELTGRNIPKRLFIGKQRIFFESDSLYLNGRLLVRNVDYSFDNSRRLFDLSHLGVDDGDTLTITYEKVPDWLQESYGRSLPDVSHHAVERIDPSPQSGQRGLTYEGSDISISGAKSFRFSARSAGASNFSQSLDLKISGHLTPGLEITGAVSDRGHDPSYGPSNSRLNELDKINLKLKSDMLAAQIGDMAVVSRFDMGSGRSQRVSGANLNIHTQRWYAEALAARPKGRFETFKFSGEDGLQGPYQIGQGANARAIVPGSEQVWLDGQLLTRGAHKDYTIDYPIGRITFSVNHPIDQRSRVEIDYELRATDYREELISSGGGVSLGDSSLSMEVEWLREGDDKSQPLMGELSDEEKNTLAAVGDSVGDAVRSGVTLDSNGSYVLIVDSLPDSIYQYVGRDSGNYSIHFSYVGSGKGDYRFLGGERYEFVGFGQGDYLPIIILSAPERTDYFSTRIGLRNQLAGKLTAEFRQTLFDQNLFSSRDDHDNQGLFYSLASSKEWQWNGQPNRLTLKAHQKEANFKTRNRLYPADFKRNFLLPEDFVPFTDETLYELGLAMSPSSVIALSPSFSRLDYRNNFGSSTGGLRADLTLHRNLDARLGWKSAAARYDRLMIRRRGEADTYSTTIRYQLSRRFELSSGYEYDRRENEYSGELKGTRYNRYLWTLDVQSERLSYQYYVEDTLTGQWSEILSRSRLAATSSRKLGLLSYSAEFTYQWLRQPQVVNEDFLVRTNLQYHNARQRLEVSSSYTLSKETRNARGISYLEVEHGQGDYIFENGEYVPDQDGNYIRVEEVLSDRSRVSRGEKSFHVAKNFRTVLIRFNSSIQEELLSQGKRKLWWAVPFLSDETQPYLFYSRRYDADIRLFPIKNSYAANLTFNEDQEERYIAGATRNKHDTKEGLVLKQAVDNTFIEESVKFFQGNRDNYFSGAGKINGYEIGFNVRRLVSSQELSAGGSYRRAESAQNERSEIYSAQLGTRVRILNRGELRTSLELYRQLLANSVDVPSFQLTGSKPGSRGAIWLVSLRYGVRDGFRVNFSLSGRHSDDRTARITGRGEMIAGF